MLYYGGVTAKPVDLGTFVVVVLLVIGAFTLAGFGREVPAFLQDALKVSIGVAVRSGYAITNDYRHRGANS